MSAEKLNKKARRDESEWGRPEDYSEAKRYKSGNKKERRSNDKRKENKWDDHEWVERESLGPQGPFLFV